MTPPLLGNELVKKYFGYKPGEIIPCNNPQTFYVEERMAYRILQAMSEPIKKGEKYLLSNRLKEVTEHEGQIDYGTWHPVALRLPDRFQPPPEQKSESVKQHCWCLGEAQNVFCCQCEHRPCHKIKPPPERKEGICKAKGCWVHYDTMMHTWGTGGCDCVCHKGAKRPSCVLFLRK